MTKMSRIQRRNREAILTAGLAVFSESGFRGATLDQIAAAAGLSKPNLLYYFKSKAAIHAALLEGLLDTWLDPLREVNPEGQAREEILNYMRRKLELSRNYPAESRLFANEILHGAPHIGDMLKSDLKSLVDEKAAVIADWMRAGEIAPSDPHHLIFSIWSLTQHYADFEVQVGAVLGPREPFEEAEAFLTTLFERLLGQSKG